MKRSILKKWQSAQTSILIDEQGQWFIEKIETQTHYGPDELEIYNEILDPLKIEHVPVIASEKTKNHSKFILKYIDGLTCSDAPTAQHLYDSSKKAGNIYKQSRDNMANLPKDLFNKYYLSRTKMLEHLSVFPLEFGTEGLIAFIEMVYDKYEKYPLVLNHFDLHFKNMIATNDKMFIIDWATAQISPFYADLYVLLRQAEEVDADCELIIENFRKSAALQKITKAEILEGGICWSIPAIYWLLELQGTDNVPFYDWAVDEYQSALQALKLYKNL